MPEVAIAARVTVKEGRADEYIAAFAPLLEQAERDPGTLLYAVHRSRDDPRVFWTAEVHATILPSLLTPRARCMLPPRLPRWPGDWAGEGPPLVMLHGLSGHARTWTTRPRR